MKIVEAGFNLIELLIVMAIIAILCSISLPAYQSHLLKVRRTEGQMALFHLASSLENYAVEHKGYQQANFESLNINPDSPHHYYRLEILHVTNADFLIAARPLQAQAKDKTCGTLAMNEKGEKGKLVGSKVEIDHNCW